MSGELSEEEIRKAAKEFAEEHSEDSGLSPDAHELYKASLEFGYFSGADWAASQLRGENERLRAELEEAKGEIRCLHMQAYGETAEEREGRKRAAHERHERKARVEGGKTR